MATYIELKARIDKLQAQADALKEKEKATVIGRIREAIEAFGLTAADLGLAGAKGRRGRRPGTGKEVTGSAPKSGKGAKASKRTKAPAVAKFADEKGNRWSGRGPRPAWFKAALEAGATPESLVAKG